MKAVQNVTPSYGAALELLERPSAQPCVQESTAGCPELLPGCALSPGVGNARPAARGLRRLLLNSGSWSGLPLRYCCYWKTLLSIK